MTLVYLVLAACLGYAFCQFCHLQRYKIARKSGWYSYLHVTSFGLAFLAGGIVIAQYAANPLCNAISWCKPNLDSEKNAIAIHAFYGAAFAAACCHIANQRVGKADALFKAWKDDLSRLLHSAIEDEGVVTIYSDSGKIFEGYVVDTFEPSEENSFVTLLPTMIGHEVTENHKIQVDEWLNEKLISASYEEAPSGDGEDSDNISEAVESVMITIPRAKIALCRKGEAPLQTSTSS